MSIARKSALLSGGDIVLVKGELGGAGFRVLLPARPMASKRILIVDDEENIGRSLRLILEREGYAVTRLPLRARSSARTPTPAARTPTCSTCGCPTATASTCCAACAQTAARRPAVMISGHGTIADAVEATRAGAFDFLEKPLGRDRVLLAVKNALEQVTLRQENERLRELVGSGPRMIGASPAWQRAVEQATMAARSDARVLLIGESGTGKELLAAHIHQNRARSPRGRS